MRRPIVDPTVCIGCGECIRIAPDVFQFTADGKAKAVNDISSDNKDKVKSSIESCPVQAISEEKYGGKPVV